MTTPSAPVDATPAPARSSRALQALVSVLVVAVLSLAALAAQDSPTPPSASAVPATGEVVAVTVTVDGMAFVPHVIEVPAGSRLEITFTNTGDQVHDLVLDSGAKTERLAPGESELLDAGVISQAVQAWCSVAGHRAMGMSLQIVTTAGDTATAGDNSTAAPPDHGMEGPAPTMAQLMEQAQLSDPTPATLAPLTDDTLREYTFTVTETEDPVTPGLDRALWTYNGTSPGPTLHGRVGDTFRITLVNEGTIGHSIDFHAGELSPDIPMRTLEPGESLVYEFTATRAGVWMYHCGTMPMSHHIANGMFGAVVIEPDGIEPVDRSFVLVQSEQYLGADGEPASGASVASLVPDVVTFNGRAFQYAAHPLTAYTGERVRVWVLNAGPNAALSFHVVGTQFDTVWTEGAYTLHHSAARDGVTQGRSGAQVLPLLAAQGGFVEMVMPEPGHYSFVNHQMSLAEKGAQGIIEVTDAP